MALQPLERAPESGLGVGRQGWGLLPVFLPLPLPWMAAAVLPDVELSTDLITALSPCSLVPLKAREAPEFMKSPQCRPRSQVSW